MKLKKLCLDIRIENKNNDLIKKKLKVRIKNMCKEIKI